MNEAVNVSTARTALAKLFRSLLNATHGATMGGHVISHAVTRAGIDPALVDGVVMGAVFPKQ